MFNSSMRKDDHVHDPHLSPVPSIGEIRTIEGCIVSYGTVQYIMNANEM